MSLAEKLTTIAENEQKVYNAGKQAGTDEFWDNLQNNGSRTDYRSAFMQTGFVHIDPKYPVNATYGDSMMCQAKSLESVNWDKFNLSAAGSLYSAFAFCGKLGRIDTVLGITNGGATLMNSVVRQCTELVSIQKIMAAPVYVWKNSFDGCTALTHVSFEGTIGANGLNLQWSTGLDKESIISIINALSTTTSGLSITLSKTAVDNAWYDSDGSGLEGSETAHWFELIAERENWTINLA